MTTNFENKHDRDPAALKPDQPLQADILAELADIAGGRVKDFDPSHIIELGKNRLAERRRFRTEDLTDEEVELVMKSKVPPGHEHLDDELKDWNP
jgi:hypothetical protein